MTCLEGKGRNEIKWGPGANYRTGEQRAWQENLTQFRTGMKTIVLWLKGLSMLCQYGCSNGSEVVFICDLKGTMIQINKVVKSSPAMRHELTGMDVRKADSGLVWSASMISG